jgi:hypothetical protein
VWVRAVGIPDNERTEFAIMELAKLVGDPEEVHLPSLHWRSVWIKVSCKNPNQIGGTSEVFINKKGRRISWFYSDKLQKYPPNKPDDDDLDDNEDDVTDEEDLESQESHGWLESGKPLPNESSAPPGVGTSTYQGRKANMSVPQSNYEGIGEKTDSSPHIDVIQEMQNLALKLNPQGVVPQTKRWQKISEMQSGITTDILKNDFLMKAPSLEFAEDDQILGHFHDESEDKEGAEKPTTGINMQEDLIASKQAHKSDDSIVGKTVALCGGNDDEETLDDSNKEVGYEGHDNGGTQKKLPELQQKGRDMINQTNISDQLSYEEQKLPDKASYFTRQSTRIQDRDKPVMEKAISRKDGIKGINSCPTSSDPIPSCSLEDISRVCGFSLGEGEATRLANISMIQAKEAALAALLSTKQKIMVSSVENRVLNIEENLAENRVLSFDESSSKDQNPRLEFSGARAANEDNLSIMDQG